MCNYEDFITKGPLSHLNLKWKKWGMCINLFVLDQTKKVEQIQDT